MKCAVKILKTYVLLLVMFTVAIVAVHTIPSDSIRNSVAKSAGYIDKEGIFFKVFGFPLFQIDNMTDCMMLNLAVYADDSHPVSASMLNYYGYNDSGSRGYFNMASDTETLALRGNGSVGDVMMYGRYWHGYQVVLRPLLVFLDYQQIRTLNYVLLFSLMLVLAAMLYSYAGSAVALLFLLSLLAVSFPIVPLAIQFSTCFYIAFVSSIVVLRFPSVVSDRCKLAVLFFVTGALTSYFDFLTTPQITLGLPLICSFISGRVRGSRLRHVVGMCSVWLLGYSLLWTSKWGMAYLLTDSGPDVLETAIGSFILRTSDSVYFGGEQMRISQFAGIVLSRLGVAGLCLAGLVAAGVLALVAAYIYRYRRNLREYDYLLCISAIVPVWYLLLRNHSLQHFFFTWRAIFVTVFGLALFAYYNYKSKKQSL